MFRPGTIAAGLLLDDSPSAVFLPSAFGYLNVEKLDDVHCNYADASLHSMGGSNYVNRSLYGEFSFLEIGRKATIKSVSFFMLPKSNATKVWCNQNNFLLAYIIFL